MSDWQPIETAPKNGTRIIATDGRYVEFIAWGDTPRRQRWYEMHSLGRRAWRVHTHWMPLPTPPESTE